MIGGLLRCKSLVLGFFLLNGCACFVLFCIISEIFFGLRARELFYYLKGGQVDYGEEHSKACGHSQFGRIYEQGSEILIFCLLLTFFFLFTLLNL